MYILLKRQTVKQLKCVKISDNVDLRIALYQDHQLKKIRDLINDTLLIVWNNSKPYHNVGYRKMYKRHVKEMKTTFDKIKAAWDIEVDKFVSNYEDYKKENKVLLKDLYRSSYYYDSKVDDIKSKFKLDLTFKEKL